MRSSIAAALSVALALAAWGTEANSLAPITFHTTKASAKLPAYPLDFEDTIDEFLRVGKPHLAADGGLEFKASRRPDALWEFHPVGHAKMCVTAYGEFARTGERSARDMLLRSATAMIGRAERGNGKMLWRYASANPTFGAGPGWISGMAQGMGMACFAGAYLVTREQLYRTAAAEAFAGMRAPFGEHGTATKFGGGVFYEEVAAGGSRPTHILNGHIFALAGIWLASLADDRRDYRAAIADGVRSLSTTVRKYETGGISLYDLGPRTLAPLGYYNVIHVAQLQWLYDLTGDRQFLKTAFRIVRLEKRMPFSIEVDGVPSAKASVAGLTTGIRSWIAPRGRTADLTLRLARASRVDEAHFVAPEGKVPASVEIAVGNVRRRVEPDGRFFTVRFPAVETNAVRLRLVPSPGGEAGLTLVALAGDKTRELAALSSDLSAYRDIGSARPPLSLFDDDASTVWASAHDHSALLVDLGVLRAKRLVLHPCPGAPRPSEVSFGVTIGGLARSKKHGLLEIDVPDGKRYVLLRWPSGACLTDMTAG